MKVKCVLNTYNPELIIGNIYEVIEVSFLAFLIKVGGRNIWVLKECFTIVEQDATVNNIKYFQKGKNYLTLIKNINQYQNLYKCEICLNEKIIYSYKVISGHDKTCGCRNGKNSFKESFTITKCGNVISKGGFILQHKIASGYYAFNKIYLHRLIAEKYIPNPNNLSDVNHIDGNKQNNHVSNLEWCTRSDNIKHAWKHGLNKGGTNRNNKFRKLDNNELFLIIKSNFSSRKLSKILKVSKTTILNIRNGIIYKNIIKNYNAQDLKKAQKYIEWAIEEYKS